MQKRVPGSHSIRWLGTSAATLSAEALSLALAATDRTASTARLARQPCVCLAGLSLCRLRAGQPGTEVAANRDAWPRSMPGWPARPLPVTARFGLAGRAAADQRRRRGPVVIYLGSRSRTGFAYLLFSRGPAADNAAATGVAWQRPEPITAFCAVAVGGRQAAPPP